LVYTRFENIGKVCTSVAPVVRETKVDLKRRVEEFMASLIEDALRKAM